MNQAKLKSYAPKARKEFIKAVTGRAAHFGITAKSIEAAKVQGDTAIIGGKAFPAKVAEIRKKLETRIEKEGFQQVIESIAYTWFNRFVAIRYMELHGFLDHGYRVLSHPEGQEIPEILSKADQVEFSGLNREQILELKLDGNKDSEIYRLLLIAQCNELHNAMPFLFEEVDNETELLLPDNLLHSDSLIRQMVDSIPEEDWKEVEILGWLYQYYISEKKETLITAKKAYKTSEIPAVTQLFTPNWIVQYMVQNSLGAQWMATYPSSQLKSKMPYYIEPAEQAEEVQKQLKEITPESLNPEELTLMDPACGSGHILVEAYNLFKEIYIERGYRPRDIPRLILEKNLYGLDIDERAAQLAGLSVLMKARTDDRSIFREPPNLNILAIQESNHLDADEIASYLLPKKSEVTKDDIRLLVHCFENAKTFGSLITIPDELKEKLPALKELVSQPPKDMFARGAIIALAPLIRQTKFLASEFDAVVANPPYLNSKYFNSDLKKFIGLSYPKFKSDMFSAFIDRCLKFSGENNWVGMMTPFVWMFLGTFEKVRSELVEKYSLHSLVHPEYHAFFDSAFVPICTFVCRKMSQSGAPGTFIGLERFKRSDEQGPMALEAIKDKDCNWRFQVSMEFFRRIPGSPIAYWLDENYISLFSENEGLGTVAEAKVGLQSSDNERFLRLWHEVNFSSVLRGASSRSEALNSNKKWFPCNKGGEFRKWYGNQDFIVNWKDDGNEIRNFRDDKGKLLSRPQNLEYYFRESVSWGDVTCSTNAFRYYPSGFIHDATAHSAFGLDTNWKMGLLSFCNNKYATEIAKLLNPTMHFTVGYFDKIPYIKNAWKGEFIEIARRCVEISKQDWESFEISWDFVTHPLLSENFKGEAIKDSYSTLNSRWQKNIQEMKGLEEKSNQRFFELNGLIGRLDPEVSMEEITLKFNPYYRFKKTTNLEFLQKNSVSKSLLSFVVGCAMGRYALDKEGLVYAGENNIGFDMSLYKTFRADDDGIIPLMEKDWFNDDAFKRVMAFLEVAWSPKKLEENIEFIGRSLAEKGNNEPEEVIRSYLCNDFFKDHLQLYKKRPIYWLFSSGKHKAFQALVYLHRYNEGTLARMRTEYVIPLQGKINSRIDQLKDDIEKETSSSHQKRLEKERALLTKQREELREFDDKLRHYADQRIKLDLDDGVKVNYGKFGDLLAEVNTVVGKKKDK